MPPVPKKKHTHARSATRKNARTNQLRLATLVRCPNCKKLKEPHKACRYCGFYK